MRVKTERDAGKIMNETDASFLAKLSRTYYYERYQMIEPPSHIRQREFGLVRAGGSMERHLSVKDEGSLRVMLLREHPLEVFASNARYLLPEQRPMEAKERQGADLIFDIDAKDLNPKCGRKHVLAACGTCGRPAGCGCGSATIKASMPCSQCIGAAKAETVRLVGVLESDFGITWPAIHFSGNEGFHVTVEGGWMADLGRRERADLADYLLVRGLLPERVGITADADNPPSVDDPGVRGRLAKAAGFRGAKPKMGTAKMAGNRQSFEEAAKKAAIRIDPNVTGDVSRVFRLAGSLNGKSCLAKVRVEDIGKFDPYVDAVVLPDDPVAVTAWCPEFTLGGNKIGPCGGKSVVPTYAAAWLVCRGLGHCG